MPHTPFPVALGHTHTHTHSHTQDILIEYVRGTCCAALNEAGRLGKLERDRGSGALKLKVGRGRGRRL